MAIQHVSVDLDNVTAYPTDPQIVLAFRPDYTRWSNDHATIGVYFSYDGVNDHGYISGKAGDNPIFHQKPERIWVRAVSDPGVSLIHVVAEQCGRGG